MSTTRIYVVEQKGTGTVRRLIDATSAAAAIRYCAQDLYAAHVAGAKDVAALMAQGRAIETATDTTQPQTQTAQEQKQ